MNTRKGVRRAFRDTTHGLPAFSDLRSEAVLLSNITTALPEVEPSTFAHSVDGADVIEECFQ